ncbi:hypothetical protein TERTU_0905 [Teredinibacter turnerae T7901]|uniref:Uncharacterized protein n=1 Tax=Teredinibacter turnerae (strain ATCC 39867 / T7901) TaxID=377629 RepID=C5BQ59_TERTT|nr:hypothetical protein TERTU_0905 [Teredinibacter turnerae T7901]
MSAGRTVNRKIDYFLAGSYSRERRQTHVIRRAKDTKFQGL